MPVYDGKLPVETARCLLQENLVAAVLGDELRICFLPNCSHPAQGRNQLAQQFMDSDCERLIFLDSDITFNPGDLVKIARRPEDFVGGAYRYKMDEESYPVGWLNKEFLQATKGGLLEVASLPGGFMSISRRVFETLRERHPERHFEHFGHRLFCWFQMPFVEGRLYGEDAIFCREWREAGGEVYLDPEIALTHWDFNKPYAGHIGNWLKRRNIKEVA